MKRFFFISIFLFILISNSLFANGSRQVEINSPIIENSELPHEETPVPENIPTRGEQVMKAFAAAYPRQIDAVEFRNGDWAVLLRGIWFYYAEGRLLPEDMLENMSEYSRQSFYGYPEELPPWREPSPEQVERFQNWENNRSQNPTRRSPLFFDTLWRVNSREESQQRLQTFRFLGKTIYVHYLILENLSLVEEHILEASRADPVVKNWIDNIGTMEGWTWRNIAETQSRSFHSYGLAVDILPKALGNRATYWIWTSNSGIDWWSVDYAKRYHPPDAVIKAFEKFGFCWGGKWLQYDTMHFEYRPEILILNGIYPETRR